MSEPAPATLRSPAVSGVTPALEMKGVGKTYGTVVALGATDLTVGHAELVTLLGPSGSGKSTILGIAAGIIAPDNGRVFFNGRDVTDRPAHERDVGMVFQRYTLFPNMTVADNVAFPLRARSTPQPQIIERVRHFLNLVGLLAQSDRYPSQISGGQAQRVALARALVFDPALLLMDEPLGALDRRLRQGLQEEIRRIHDKTKVPTLYVTHDQEEAMNLSDRIVLVRDGCIAAAGAPRELYLGPRTLWSAEFLGDINRCAIASIADRADGRCTVTTDTGMRVRARIFEASPASSPHALVIRPEDCRVSAQKPPGRESFGGTIVGTAFLGSFQRLQVRLDSGWTIAATLPGQSLPYDPGTTIYCDWDEDAPMVVVA